MPAPSPGFAVAIRLEAPTASHATTDLVAAVGRLGGSLTTLAVVETRHNSVLIDVSVDAFDADHSGSIAHSIRQLPGFVVHWVSDLTLTMHLGGKLQVCSTVPLTHRDDLSRAYTPGVARICEAIASDPGEARRLTIKRNTVAVVTDGSAVLGLGNLGPSAALPVMEGKAALFKHFADVDAWPVCLDTQDTERIVDVVTAIAPVYGGINLEDIAAPRCFEIERRLRERLDIPVFHDDQHGTAIVVLAALTNALKVVAKDLACCSIVVSGTGAAGSAIIRLLHGLGARHIVAADVHGVLPTSSAGCDENRGWIIEHTNPEGIRGNLKSALRGADVFIGVSAGNILTAADLTEMNSGAIVFALANPLPEVDPREALRHAAVVATGRSDHPNQINNVLAFPGVFRGLLDCGATAVTEPMLVGAASAIANCVKPEDLCATRIVPSVFDVEVAAAVAGAVRSQHSATLPVRQLTHLPS